MLMYSHFAANSESHTLVHPERPLVSDAGAFCGQLANLQPEQKSDRSGHDICHFSFSPSEKAFPTFSPSLW